MVKSLSLTFVWSLLASSRAESQCFLKDFEGIPHICPLLPSLRQLPQVKRCLKDWGNMETMRINHGWNPRWGAAGGYIISSCTPTDKVPTQPPC